MQKRDELIFGDSICAKEMICNYYIHKNNGYFQLNDCLSGKS